jgi:hypothetical protein
MTARTKTRRSPFLHPYLHADHHNHLRSIRSRNKAKGRRMMAYVSNWRRVRLRRCIIRMWMREHRFRKKLHFSLHLDGRL